MPKLVAAKCPSCGAGLEIDPSASEITCAYCGQSNFIVGSQKAARKLEGPTIVAPPAASGVTIASVIIGVVMVGVLASVVAVVVSGLPDSGELRGQAGPPLDQRAATLAKEHNLDNPPPRSEHAAHDECICRTDMDGDEGLETTAQVATRAFYLPGDEILTTYWIDISGPKTGMSSWYLPVDERSAPPMSVDTHYVSIYMACHASVMMLAAGDRATGWDLDKREAIWTTPLGGAYTADAEVPPVVEGKFTHQCTRLNASVPVVEVPTKHGVVSIRLADGVVVEADPVGPG